MAPLTAYSLLRRHPIKLKLFIDFQSYKHKHCAILANRGLHGPPKVNEHSNVPLYPPIPKFKDKKESNVAKTKNFMANLGTVEEKQYQINRPKYYGWYSYMIDQRWIPCDAGEFLRFATQTHVVDGLPEYYNAVNGSIDNIVNEIAPFVEQTILNHSLYSEHSFEVENDFLPMRDSLAVNIPEGNPGALAAVERKRNNVLVRAIHQIIMGSLLGKVMHLEKCSEDFCARNEAFWFRGGIGPDKNMVKKRVGNQKNRKDLRDKGHHIRGGDGKISDITDEEIMEPYERALQFKGSNLIQLRCDIPLPPFIDRDDALVTQSKVPISSHDPRTWGYVAKCQHGTNVPGYWPDADHQHGLLLYCDRSNIWNQQAVASTGALSSPEVIKEQNTCKALLSCFGWLLPQACHLGFSPMTEITFPLSTQATVTDGKTWSYYAYQLNTTDLTTNKPDEHKHNNVMWVGEDNHLFTGVENGKVLNFTPSALAPLLKMYMLEPQVRQYSLTPYLSEVKTVSNFHDPYQREFLHSTVRHMYSNRPRHYAKPEMYLWEKISLVDHPGPYALQMGLRRRRWFQMYKVSHLGKEHWHPEFESYDNKKNRYIPKALRPEDYMRKKGLGRRYNKFLPKLTVPLEEKAAVYKLPKTTSYQPPE